MRHRLKQIAAANEFNLDFIQSDNGDWTAFQILSGGRVMALWTGSLNDMIRIAKGLSV